MDRSTSLLKALDLMTILGGHADGFTVQELAATMNLPRTTVIRILNTVVEYGFAAKHERKYFATEAFTQWAHRDRHAMYRERYRPFLEKVAAGTGELVLLGLLEGAGVVHIDFIAADHRLKIAPAPSTHHSIRYNALGKLVLSKRPDLAASWMQDDAKFWNELQEIRDAGVA